MLDAYIIDAIRQEELEREREFERRRIWLEIPLPPPPAPRSDRTDPTYRDPEQDRGPIVIPIRHEIDDAA